MPAAATLSFARGRGARVVAHDALMGVVAIVASKHGYDGGTLVEAAPDGWWYSARLPEDRAVVAFMSDTDIVREQRLHDATEFLALLETSHATRARIGEVEIIHGRPPVPHSRRSSTSRTATAGSPPAKPPSRSTRSRRWASATRSPRASKPRGSPRAHSAAATERLRTPPTSPRTFSRTWRASASITASSSGGEIALFGNAVRRL